MWPRVETKDLRVWPVAGKEEEWASQGQDSFHTPPSLPRLPFAILLFPSWSSNRGLSIHLERKSLKGLNNQMRKKCGGREGVLGEGTDAVDMTQWRFGVYLIGKNVCRRIWTSTCSLYTISTQVIPLCFSANRWHPPSTLWLWCIAKGLWCV